MGTLNLNFCQDYQTKIGLNCCRMGDRTFSFIFEKPVYFPACCKEIDNKCMNKKLIDTLKKKTGILIQIAFIIQLKYY